MPADLENPAQYANQVAVYVRLDDGGHVTWRMDERSTNDDFNASIERAMDKFTAAGGETLPLPDDAEVRAAVLHHGLMLREWTYTGK